MPDDRQLALAGGHNFRDFGGYPTSDGRTVRRGVLFRSGVLAYVAPEDAPALRGLGIATICDLRTRTERAHEPTCWPEAPCETLYDDEVVSLATLQALVVDPASTGAQARAAMVELYRDLPFRHAPVLAPLFRRLVDGRVPLLINCSAGKDRTGVAAAFVLRALGVTREEIVADFLASNAALDVRRLLADTGYAETFRNRPDLVRGMMEVRPAYLAAAFVEVEARCGSFWGYLKTELGVDEDDLVRMREALLV